MRPLVLIAVLVPLLVAVGCAKKRPKDTGSSPDPRENVKLQPAPAPSADKKNEKADEPNWLKDGRVKTDKGQIPVEGPASDGKQPWKVGPPEGGFEGAVAVPQPAQPPVGGAQKPPVAVQPNAAPAPVAPGTPATVGKKVEEADLKDVWTFIENASGATGRVPAPATTLAALIEAKSPAAELVRGGAIILVDAKQREGVWAFEAQAYLNGGRVVTQNGVETLTAAQLKQRLGK